MSTCAPRRRGRSGSPGCSAIRSCGRCGVVRRHCVFEVEIVGQRQVERRRKAVLPRPGLRNQFREELKNPIASKCAFTLHEVNVIALERSILQPRPVAAIARAEARTAWTRSRPDAGRRSRPRIHNGVVQHPHRPHDRIAEQPGDPDRPRRRRRARGHVVRLRLSHLPARYLGSRTRSPLATRSHSAGSPPTRRTCSASATAGA